MVKELLNSIRVGLARMVSVNLYSKDGTTPLSSARRISTIELPFAANIYLDRDVPIPLTLQKKTEEIKSHLEQAQVDDDFSQ